MGHNFVPLRLGAAGVHGVRGGHLCVDLRPDGHAPDHVRGGQDHQDVEAGRGRHARERPGDPVPPAPRAPEVLKNKYYGLFSGGGSGSWSGWCEADKEGKEWFGEREGEGLGGEEGGKRTTIH